MFEDFFEVFEEYACCWILLILYLHRKTNFFNMKKKIEKRIIIDGEEYLTKRQLAEREGFSTEGIAYRAKKIGLGKKFEFSNRILYPLKDVEEAERQGKLIKFN